MDLDRKIYLLFDTQYFFEWVVSYSLSAESNNGLRGTTSCIDCSSLAFISSQIPTLQSGSCGILLSVCTVLYAVFVPHSCLIF